MIRVFDNGGKTADRYTIINMERFFAFMGRQGYTAEVHNGRRD